MNCVGLLELAGAAEGSDYPASLASSGKRYTVISSPHVPDTGAISLAAAAGSSIQAPVSLQELGTMAGSSNKPSAEQR